MSLSLGDRIREVLAIDPSADAIEYAERWYTWGDLSRVAEGVDRCAGAQQLGAAAPVGVLMQNRPEVVASILGMVMSGRCVVTLSPHQGASRLAADLKALRLPLVIATSEGWEGSLGAACVAAGSQGVEVTDSGARLRDGVDLQPPAEGFRAPMPGVAVEMLTSGTTGPPKRIELRSDAIATALLGSKHYEATRKDAASLRSGIAILSAPLVHVAGIFRTLQCVSDGRRFALMDRFELGAWLELVERHEPRTVSLVPAALRSVLEADVAPESLESIRAVVSGTAPLAPADAVAFEEKYDIPVLVSYGATEFAGGVAGWSLELHRKYAAEKRGSVGRAHPGCELRVVSAESGSQLAPGEIGLLEVRSAQIGNAGVDGVEAWVRTTDLAELDPDGFLFIRGRADAAIVRGGFKVMPDEVVCALEKHPCVREAAVVGIDDARLGQRPVAAVELVEPDAGAEPVSVDALLEFARDLLARYEVPSELRIVEALPRTPSLKVSQPGVRALFEGFSSEPEDDEA
ncbi:MAG: AMP-binding protein [Myxococcota bacterium]|nr:AMP-binding protein [Myxococcota bacterium]